jgi:hypothetical protein
MMRRLVAAMLSLALGSSIALSGCVSFSQVILEEDFETGMGQWEEGRDLPIDPETGEPLNASISIVEWGRNGQSLLMTIDGRQDDGTLWIQTRQEVNRTGEIVVEIEFYLYCENASFNIIAHPVAFAGTSPPVGEDSFHKLGNANPEAGWNLFTVEITLTMGEQDELHIALGITVAWETWMSYAIDDVRVTIR